MSNKVRIEQWGVKMARGWDGYTPPELQGIALGGTVYELGEVHPEYKEYLDKERPNWDPENPITLL